MFFLLPILLSLTLSTCGGDWRGFQSSFRFEGSATLNWEPPSSNIDGTNLKDLGGYIIYYGQSSGYYTRWIDVGNVSSYTISNLPNGTYYFAITSYDIFGNESEMSNELHKAI